MAKILALHGANLNMLGIREPEVYGYETLVDIEERLTRMVSAAGHEFESFQSNAEHELVDRVQRERGLTDFIVINPGAFTHTSIALRDALLGVAIPFIEVHLSNIYSRESFRHHSYFSDVAAGTIIGLGSLGYDLAVQAGMARLADSRKST
ncbi:MAG: type II 3-dehydroquinate dehydratase [Proteobacteria bacterium]|jgi:3-dehydroquinate dehydratase II|nr:type II 3-dehydroquinate dehydratase [Pseudomonadota bacterium]